MDLSLFQHCRNRGSVYLIHGCVCWGGDGIIAIAEKMRAALKAAPSAAPEEDEEEEDEATQDPPSQKTLAARTPSQKKNAARRRPLKATPNPSQKKPAALRPPLKRPASHTTTLPPKRQQRPATTSTETHPNLRFPAVWKQSHMHYKQSRAYTDVKDRRWRLYRRAGGGASSSKARIGNVIIFPNNAGT